jgi:hypothetical protein
MELFVHTACNLQNRVSLAWHERMVQEMKQEFGLELLPKDESFAAFGEARFFFFFCMFFYFHFYFHSFW